MEHEEGAGHRPDAAGPARPGRARAHPRPRRARGRARGARQRAAARGAARVHRLARPRRPPRDRLRHADAPQVRRDRRRARLDRLDELDARTRSRCRRTASSRSTAPSRRGRLPARLRGALEPPAAPRQERPLRRRVVGRDLRRAARARAPVLLPRPRARARGADRQPHRVRARAHPDLLAGAHVRARSSARSPMSSGAGRCPSPAWSTARRCRTSCASGARCRRPPGSPRPSASSPRRRDFGGKRSIPWGPQTVHDFLHAKLVVCDDWAFAGSYNHSRAGEENAENVLAIDGKAVRRPGGRDDPRVRRALRAGPARTTPGRLRPLGPLTPQLDGRRPQLAAELLEQRAAHLGHVHGQRQRALASARRAGVSARSPARARCGRRPATNSSSAGACGARISSASAQRAVVGVARLLDAAAAEAVRRRAALLVAVLDEAHAVPAADEPLVLVDARAVAAQPDDQEPDQPRRGQVRAQRRRVDAVGAAPSARSGTAA